MGLNHTQYHFSLEKKPLSTKLGQDSPLRQPTKHDIIAPMDSLSQIRFVGYSEPEPRLSS